MPNTLLQTKLVIPPLRPQLVPRPRLIERLNTGLQGRGQAVIGQPFARKLTLVSAPAGFGKTTLVSDWIRHSERSVAWLSLDEGDNDLTRFLIYFVAALRSLMPEIGEGVLSALQTSGIDVASQSVEPLSIEPVLTSLLNDLSAVHSPFSLVLDDYHVIEAPAIHEALSFLLDHQPSQSHLVITTRADPPLPLSRLRARGELTEVRTDDLRFTAEEVAHFLNDMMGLTLSTDDIQALDSRTEGWIAGLQLAALSMQRAADLSGFVSAFSGTNRYILDYLVDEVLDQQPEKTKQFLLQTSILDRLSGSLCDAVTERSDGQITLERLEADNLFIVPLDDDRHWYRYHHLFADLLRDRLQRTQSNLLPSLHARASKWYEDNGRIIWAVDHALRAGHHERATYLVEQSAEDMLWRGEVRTLLRWLKELPEEQVRDSPRLCIAKAWTYLLAGEFEDFESIERSLQEAELAARNIADEAAVRRQGLLAEVGAIRAIIAVERGDTFNGIELARKVRGAGALPADKPFLRSLLNFTLGLAYGDTGETQMAVETLTEAKSTSENSNNVLTALVASYELAKLKIEQGHLRRAEALYYRSMELAERHFGRGVQLIPLAGAADVGLGMLLYEWNELEGAQRHLEKGVELTRQRGGLGIARDGYLALALVRQAQGDPQGANHWIEHAVEHARHSPRPDAVLRADPYRLRLWLAQGEMKAVAQWIEQNRIDPGPVPDYPVEIIAVWLARAYLVQASLGSNEQLLQKAMDLLNWLLPVVESHGRMGRAVEILTLQALVYYQQEQLAQALYRIEEGLLLAEPEGYVRLFVDEGEPMARLLYEAGTRGIMPGYTRKLLEAFPETPETPSAAPGADEPSPELIEPLSQREQEVLELVAEGFSNREIGLKLHLSPNTIKRHTINIYQKLDVHNRTQAVARARVLGILPPR